MDFQPTILVYHYADGYFTQRRSTIPQNSGDLSSQMTPHDLKKDYKQNKQK